MPSQQNGNLAARKSVVFIALSMTLIIAVAVYWFFAEAWVVRNRLATAQTALKSREYLRALAELDEVVQTDNSNPEAFLLFARTLRHLRRFDEAKSALKKATVLGAPAERLKREQWLIMAQSGQLNEALPHFAELLVAPGDDGAEICEAFAHGLISAYRLPESIEVLQAWEKDYPQDPEPHFLFAKLQKAQFGPTSRVIERLQKAVMLAPDRDDIRLELATTLLELRDNEGAEAHFLILLKRLPENVAVQVGWCRVLMENGQIENARSRLLNLTEKYPNNFSVMLLLGQLELAAKRNTEALNWLQQAVLLRNYDREARYSLASAMQALGRTEEAQAHFDYVARAQAAHSQIGRLVARILNNSSDVESRLEIANLIQQYGDPTEYVLWLDSILAIDAHDTRAQASLTKYYQSMEPTDRVPDNLSSGGPPPSMAPSESRP
jgi:thioredoxin-like negative regulator of GroEL